MESVSDHEEDTKPRGRKRHKVETKRESKPNKKKRHDVHTEQQHFKKNKQTVQKEVIGGIGEIMKEDVVKDFEFSDQEE